MLANWSVRYDTCFLPPSWIETCKNFSMYIPYFLWAFQINISSFPLPFLIFFGFHWVNKNIVTRRVNLGLNLDAGHTSSLLGTANFIHAQTRHNNETVQRGNVFILCYYPCNATDLSQLAQNMCNEISRFLLLPDNRV